jgi:hypothetical protein
MDVERTTVDVRYSCRRCQRSWTGSFDVARWSDDDGVLVESFLSDGVPVPPPRCGPRCPFCGGLPVDWVEAPFLQPPPKRAVTSAWQRYDVPQPPQPFMHPRRPQLPPRTRRFP